MRDDTHTASSKAVSPVPAGSRQTTNPRCAEASRGRQGLSDLEPGLHDLDPCSFPASDQRNPRARRRRSRRGRGCCRCRRKVPTGYRSERQSLDRAPVEQERFVDGDATTIVNARSSTKFAAREREKLTLVQHSESPPTRHRACWSAPRPVQLEAAMFVPEMTRSLESGLGILDLQHRQASETHGGARVVEQCSRSDSTPATAARRNRLSFTSALERCQPVGNRGTLAQDLRESPRRPCPRGAVLPRRLVISCRRPNARPRWGSARSR